MKIRRTIRYFRLWRDALRDSGVDHFVILGMVLSIWSGVVVGKTFVERLKVCRQCPAFDRKRLRCGNADISGCGCFVIFKALDMAPYGNAEGELGCWGRISVGPDEGWGAVRHARARDVILSLAALLGVDCAHKAQYLGDYGNNHHNS